MNDDSRDLVDAVNDLTKPDVVVRLTGGSHDHAWMELVRNVTKEERQLAKAEKRKIGRTVETGEWWCPFCDLVADTKPEEGTDHTVDRRDDPPLLDQLEARVRSSLSDGGAAGAAGTSVLVDVGAFDLSRRIRDNLNTWWAEVGLRPHKATTLAQMLTSWHLAYIAGTHPIGGGEYYRIAIDRWVTEIRDLLDPPDQIPYRDQPCPICGEKRAIRDLEGEVTDTVALWAVLRPSYRNEGSYGICKACDNVLARDADPIALRQKMNGTITDATRLTQTIAEASQTG